MIRLLLALIRRTYAALLLLLPGEVRHRHGAEMRSTSDRLIAETLQRRGIAAALAAGLAECLDLIATALRGAKRAPAALAQDLRHAWRLLGAQPASSLTVVATLALGIGAATTMFTVVNALLLRPLPYADPDRLVLLQATAPTGVQRTVSPLDFVDFTRGVPSFASTVAMTPEQLNLTGVGEPERVNAAAVTPAFFDVVGSAPVLGRGFTEQEAVPGHERVVVIGDGLWRRLGADPAIVGRDLMLDGVPHLVVGVASPALTFPDRPDVWRPLLFTPRQLDPSQRGAQWVRMAARLRPDATLQQAQAETAAFAARLAQDAPRTHRDRGARVIPLRDQIVASARPALLGLFGAVALVLLIACANVANLLLARFAARSGEMAIRMALGASRTRVWQQYLTECLLLTSLAAVGGLIVAVWGTQSVVAALPDALPRAEEIAVDWRVAAFAIGIAFATAALLGSLASLAPHEFAAATGVSRATPATGRFVRRSLVVAEVAMALVLLTAAGVCLKSVARLYAVPPGFDPSRILTFSLTMPPATYPEAEDVARFIDRVQGALQRRPGVEAAAGIFGLPLTDDFSAQSSFEISGRVRDPENEPSMAMRVATPGYFRTMGITLVKGRDFEPHDTGEAPGVAIINQAAARRHWPGEDPVGQTIRLHAGLVRGRQPHRQIVGVVQDVRYNGLDTATEPEVYIPHAQHPVDALVIAVRTAADPRHFVPDARSLVAALDPALPVSGVATMEEIVAGSMAARRFSLALLGAFSTFALVLAALGVYGVLMFTVGRRTKEIGVRMAMGAARPQVLRLVLAEGLALVAAGLALGLAGTIALSGLVRGLLYEVQPHDPETLAITAATLALVAVAASYIPARRAASVDPMTALRAE